MQIGLEYICIEHFDIVEIFERPREDWYEARVELERDDFFRPLCKLRSQHADSRAYLNNAGVFVRTAGLRHARADGRIYQKVLTERLRKSESVSREYFFYSVDI